ncbi:hypothetical protein BD626DRAFT_523924 [Schizophyllum amplum]|uniref:Uncharacterized protein n=1 Tax=Schizophyllum amplum TaxID=97359 RepID=A0A550BSS2_9AGAR|nr:hypothetical protein BD626DRAFT_523924 [Auriculariopsis ampla]
MGVARPLVTELDALAVWREATGSVHPRSGGPRRSRQGLNGQERDLGKGAEGRNSRLEGGTGTHGPPGTSDSIAVTGDGGVGDVTRGQADFASDHASHGLSCETFRRSEQSVCHPFRLLSSILPYKSDDGFPRRPPSPTITGTMDATSALVASPDNATVTSQTPNITIGGASSQAAIPAPPSVASTVTQGAFTNKATIHTKSNNHSAASDPLPPITHPSTGIGSTAESDSHRVLPRRCENNGKPLASLEHESGTMVRAYLAQRIDEHVVWVRQLMDAYSESAAHKIMDELEGKQRVLTAGKHLLREIEEMEALQGRLANARRASATQVADLRKTGKGKKNNGHQ